MTALRDKRLEDFLSGDADEEALRLLIEDLKADPAYAATLSEARALQGMVRAAAISDDELSQRTAVSMRICRAESPAVAHASGDAIMNRISTIDAGRRTSRRRLFSVLAVAAAAVIAGLFWYAQPARFGQISEAGVGFDLYRDGVQVVVSDGMRIRHGDIVVGSADTERLTIRTTDGTKVTVRGKTRLQCRRSGPAQHVMLEAGSVRLDVRPQEPGHPLMVVTPLARATVVGTTLTITSTVNATLLEVATGAVLFANLHEDRMVVEAGQHATARRGERRISGTTTVIKPPPAVVAGYNRWLAWRKALSSDPDLVVHYDFQQAGDMSGILHNQAKAPEDPIYPRNIDGRIHRGTWSDGRFPGLKHSMLLQGDAYLECGRDESIRIDGALTCLMWFKPLVIRDGWTGLMTTGPKGWGLQLDGKYGAVNFYYHTTDGYENARSYKSLGLNEWHLAVGVYDGTHSHIYLDGELLSSQIVSGKPVENPDPLMIGGNFFNKPNRHFQGWVDQAVLLNRALTPEEVAEAWQAGKP